MKVKLLLTGVITLGLWFLAWIWVQSDGEARKVVAEGVLEGISAKIVSLDSHIASSLKDAEVTKESDGVFLLSIIDSDFTLINKEPGAKIPSDEGALYYPVRTTRGDFFLRVGYSYFLENGGSFNDYARSLTGYAIISAPANYEITRSKLREALSVDDGNYFYHRVIKEMPDDQQLIIVAYIDKPLFYKLIHPAGWKELLTRAGVLVSLFGFIYLLGYCVSLMRRAEPA